MQIKPTARPKQSLLPIVIAICVTLVLIAAVGGWVHVQRLNIAQRDKELSQQRELKEKELQAIKEAADIEADGQRDAARSACRASGKSWFEC